jgi:hypothetical protein
LRPAESTTGAPSSSVSARADMLARILKSARINPDVAKVIFILRFQLEPWGDDRRRMRWKLIALTITYTKGKLPDSLVRRFPSCIRGKAVEGVGVLRVHR